ncbi:MAG: hypothetical protein Q8S21_02610 [Candidatus Paracaedibacteraceae bacterium]|nr:hypothetical protein [Candidatus Paracaedibacteraceae bacterium]
MKHAAFVSFIIHGIIFILILMDLGNPFNRVIKDNSPMVIDFVKISDRSAAPKLAPMNQKKQDIIKPPEEIKPVETTPPPPEEEKVLEDVKPVETPKQEREQKKPDQKPEPKKEESKIDPDSAHILKKEDKKKDSPKKEEKKPDTKKKDDKKKDSSKEKDKKKEVEKKKTTKSDDKALVNLHKTKNTNKDKKVDPKAKSSQKSLNDILDKLIDEDGADSKGAPADSIAADLTANELDAVRQTLRKCWTFHAGSQGAKDIVVDIQMELEPDGTVKSAEIMDKDRLAKDPAFRTAAESAKRAVLDPNCSPLPLPPKKYEQWKTSAFRFDPKDM